MECLAIIRNGVPNSHALISEINSVYCDEKKGLTTRIFFGNDLQARSGERFLWMSKKCHAHGVGFTPHLNNLVEFVEKGLGRRFLRDRGSHRTLARVMHGIACAQPGRPVQSRTWGLVRTLSHVRSSIRLDQTLRSNGLMP